jgi:hypothetical protein
MREKYKQEFQAYYDSPDVQTVFATYDKSLVQMFEMYSKFDSRDGGRLSYNSYVKMGQKT